MKRFVTVALSLIQVLVVQAGAFAHVADKPVKKPPAAKPPNVVENRPKLDEPQKDPKAVVSYRMKIVTQWGTEFTGVVRRTKEFDDAFENSAQQMGSKFDPQKFIELRWFNGLNGSVSFRFRDIRTIEKLDSLTNEHISQIETKQAGDRTKRLEVEQVRLSIVHEQREAKKQAESELAMKAADAKIAKDLAELESPPQYKVWLDKYPPDKGWIPAKKAQLYYNQTVLGMGALKPDEKDWIDHYEEWKAAYDWWVAEQKAITGVEPPSGNDNLDHPAGAMNDENALKLRKLPPTIPPDDTSPLPPPDAPGKPAPLDPGVDPPIKTDGKN